ALASPRHGPRHPPYGSGAAASLRVSTLWAGEAPALAMASPCRPHRPRTTCAPSPRSDPAAGGRWARSALETSRDIGRWAGGGPGPTSLGVYLPYMDEVGYRSAYTPAAGLAAVSTPAPDTRPARRGVDSARSASLLQEHYGHCAASTASLDLYEP